MIETIFMMHFKVCGFKGYYSEYMFLGMKSLFFANFCTDIS